MKPGKGQDGSVNWGHPGRKLKGKEDPLGDMGVGNRRPLLIALAIGAVALSGLYLAWEKHAEAEEEAAIEAGTAPADSADAANGSKPASAQIRDGVEELLKSNKPLGAFRKLTPEEAFPKEKPVVGL